MLHQLSRIPKVGKRAFRPPRTKTLPGRCTWCLKYDTQLERDHVLKRSLFPGPLRDHARNIVLACHSCNQRRARGWRPDFARLPKRVQEFALGQWPIARLERHFRNVHIPRGD